MTQNQPKMPKIEIYKLGNSCKQELIATCTLASDGVEITGEENFVMALKNTGIADYTDNQMGILFPKDGQKFLDQLKFNFRSGYLLTHEVK